MKYPSAPVSPIRILRQEISNRQRADIHSQNKGSIVREMLRVVVSKCVQYFLIQLKTVVVLGSLGCRTINYTAIESRPEATVRDYY